jgi:hypothetical protein
MENNTMTYDEILYGWQKEKIEDVAQFRSTWPNGNEPDGETTVVISIVCGETESGEKGYILTCDDNNCGGSQREAGDAVYATKDEAIAAAKAYAAEHDEVA